jgi:8-amino-7-oxononanoate synthase
MLDDISKALSFVKNEGLFPDIFEIKGASTNPKVIVNGKEVVAFCSNNYLGMATNSEVVAAVKEAVDQYGMGSGGSRLVSGNINIQKKLEESISKYKGYEDAILFSTGYMANTGTIPSIIGPLITSRLSIAKSIFYKDTGVVFSDELNHASIVDGVRLVKAERYIFKHKDMTDLEEGLIKYRKNKKKLIVTDGVFSMDGDIAPLEKILYLAEKYDAIVLLDDAHATGVLGPKGRGTAEYFNISKNPRLITMGTFTKAFGGVGGFIVGPKDLIEYLRITARTYIFSAPIPPAIVSGLLKSVELLEKNTNFRESLRENVVMMHDLLRTNQFNILESETQILPIIIGDEVKAQKVSRKLLDAGFFVPAVRWPATPKGLARLRVTLMATHTKEQIKKFVDTLLSIRNELKF